MIEGEGLDDGTVERKIPDWITGNELPVVEPSGKKNKNIYFIL